MDRNALDNCHYVENKAWLQYLKTSVTKEYGLLVMK